MALHQRRRTMKRHSIEGVASPKPIQAEAPTVPSRAPVLTISSEAATITADDPGVQLLLRRQSADGTVRDLTGLAGWRVDPPGSAAPESGGLLRQGPAGGDGFRVDDGPALAHDQPQGTGHSLADEAGCPAAFAGRRSCDSRRGRRSPPGPGSVDVGPRQPLLRASDRQLGLGPAFR